VGVYPSSVLPGAFPSVLGRDLRLPAGAAAQGRSRRLGIVERQPNKRLEQTPPGVYGRIPFVNVHLRRRSSAAPR
jgi:hypothetical protein